MPTPNGTDREVEVLLGATGGMDPPVVSFSSAFRPVFGVGTVVREERGDEKVQGLIVLYKK